MARCAGDDGGDGEVKCMIGLRISRHRVPPPLQLVLHFKEAPRVPLVLNWFLFVFLIVLLDDLSNL